MEFGKSSEGLVNTFHAALPDDPRVVRRRTFGSQCAYVGGNMVAGVHRDGIFVRLAEPELTDLLAQPGAHLFDPMGSRPMRAYAVIPPSIMADPDALATWLAKAIVHGFSMPEKEKAKPKARAKK